MLQSTDDGDFFFSHSHHLGDTWSSHFQHEHMCRFYLNDVDHSHTLAQYLQSIHAIGTFLLIRVDCLSQCLCAALRTVGHRSQNIPFIHHHFFHLGEEGETELCHESRNSLHTHWRQYQSWYSHQILVNLLHQHCGHICSLY